MPHWKMPGENAVVDIDGKKVTLKHLTWGDKIALAQEVQNLEPNEYRLVNLLKILAKHIVAIEGYEGKDVFTVLDSQPLPVIVRIRDAVLDVGEIMEELEKN